MRTDIYNNRPHDFKDGVDLFGTSFKAESIKQILEQKSNYFDENNMIALYGRWGSGKTSIMKFLEENLKEYEVIFFEAWKYENDTNLPLSLFELMLDHIDDEESTLKKLIDDAKLCANTLLTFGKNILLNSDISVLGIKASIGKVGKDTISEMTETVVRKSYYSKIDEFNMAFNNLLDKYYELHGKKLLIFIDDLDRCEPDNVLTLLSSIKHFFTESNKVLYFCGLDKLAVGKAIKKKYDGMIEAEEYLEKIFDVTFNMPERLDISHLIDDFFARVENFYKVPKENFDVLLNFIEHIRFTNPRNLKKVFNKYIFLCDLASSEDDTKPFRVIPENFKEQNAIQMIFTLFIIILYEFHREIFEDIYDYETKIGSLINSFKNESIFVNSHDTMPISQYLNIELKRMEYLSINNDLYNALLSTDKKLELLNLLFLLTPPDIKNISVSRFGTLDIYNAKDNLLSFLSQFRTTKHKILYLFSTFVLEVYTKQYKDGKVYPKPNNFYFFDLLEVARHYF